MIPAWAYTSIWWSVYPLGACGAPIRDADFPGPHHRLGRLENWLDHIVEIGCNGLALGPIWTSTSHGYDVVNHFTIDPRLGDDQDFDDLVNACRRRGIRVLLDGVFNHVSRDHAWVSSVLEEGRASQWAPLLRFDDRDPQGLSRFEGHGGLIELDHSHSEVVDYVASVMNHWLDRGADGWRLDAAYRVPNQFWAQVLPEVRTLHPDSLVVAEVLHGDYAGIAQEAGFDSVTQYELWKAIWSALKDRNPHELMWALTRHDETRGRELPWTFVSNHDVTRIASMVGLQGAKVATGILMALSGTPAIYYGDEFGWLGEKTESWSSDDQIRPVLGEYPGWSSDQEQILGFTKAAIHLRRSHPWLVDAELSIIECSQSVLRWKMTGKNSESIHVELNLAATEPHLRISDAAAELLAI
ncbi:MAG: alpha-amylase family glycosyl hydrolase [Propionibacteriaceae bacterium]|nr:alpha-amylase family glycosyl hydrolase [Propionibacteriaceae bacterium]